jgi:hypothetical protein
VVLAAALLASASIVAGATPMTGLSGFDASRSRTETAAANPDR